MCDSCGCSSGVGGAVGGVGGGEGAADILGVGLNLPNLDMETALQFDSAAEQQADAILATLPSQNPALLSILTNTQVSTNPALLGYTI